MFFIEDLYSKDYIHIINQLTNELLIVRDELQQYKNFHDAIIENKIINEKFNSYENEIVLLKEKNKELYNNIQEYKNLLNSSHSDR